jgi:exonuclease III
MNTCLNIDDHHGNKKNANIPGLRAYEALNMANGMNLCKLYDAGHHYGAHHGRQFHEKWTFWSARCPNALVPTSDRPGGCGWRLDYILVQNLVFYDVKVIRTGKTDHSPIALYFK